MWNRSENQIKLIMIRHGATEANLEHRYLGKTDEGLCEAGILALRERKAKQVYPNVDYLFCSPMKRCMETAAILYPNAKPMIIPEWEEMDFGAFEGKNYVDLQEDARYQAWVDSNGTLPFPEGESREEFIRRCECGFVRMIRQLETLLYDNFEKKSDETVRIGLVVHGGSIMAMLSLFCGGEYFDYQVTNGGAYICSLAYEKERVKLHVLEKR